MIFRGKIVVPAGLEKEVLREFHDFRGHFGANRTRAMIAK